MKIFEENKKVLLSAYACEPNKGSEPEVGWQWMQDWAKCSKEVVVITRKNNKENIENSKEFEGLTNVTFEYYDLPKWASFWKKKKRGVQVYAYLWEVFTYFFLKKKYKKKSFDIAQRVTFVSYRFPSFISYFGKRFIFGPVAGGERYPWKLLKIQTPKARVREIIRMIVMYQPFFDPFVLSSFRRADLILAVTKETKSIIPNRFKEKIIIKPAIKIKADDLKVDGEVKRSNEKFKLLYVGQLHEFKGFDFVFKAMRAINDPRIEFDIIGGGPGKSVLKEKSQDLNVRFLGKIPRNELGKYYSAADLFAFLSLHDSGGMVVLEGKIFNLPVITFNMGGPANFVEEMDTVIEPTSIEDVVKCVIDDLNQRVDKKFN